MSSSQKGIHTCPRCDRTVATDGGRFKSHSLVEGGVGCPCPLSEQHTPIVGLSAHAMLARAYVVADLADQVQDRDPGVVWEVLTALPAVELQRLLVVALAAVPTDRTIEQLYGWVCALPAAKAVVS